MRAVLVLSFLSDGMIFIMIIITATIITIVIINIIPFSSSSYFLCVCKFGSSSLQCLFIMTSHLHTVQRVGLRVRAVGTGMRFD